VRPDLRADEPRTISALWSWGISVVVHGVLVGGFAWVAFHSLGGAPQPRANPAEPQSVSPIVEIDLPTVALGDALENRPPDPDGVPPNAHGGNPTPRLDTGKAGAGGDPSVAEQAVNMSDGDEYMRLSPDLLSRLDRDQLQRLLAARARQSFDDRRATTHPAELTFVANGAADLEQRRPLAASDPSRGALVAPRAGVLGSDLGAPDQGEGGSPRTASGSDKLGGASAGAGVGVANGAPGDDHRIAAPVASQRPDVTQAPVAVNANDVGKPKDDVDTEQEVATTLKSLVHASTAGGEAGEGRGGVGGGGDPGAGAASGSGSKSSAAGDGIGDAFDIDSSDPRLFPWLRQVKAKLYPLTAHAFPKSAIEELKQGYVFVALDVTADGGFVVAWPPVRASGIAEFDKNCASAIRSAGHLPPIPPQLGKSRLRVTVHCIASHGDW
jgi:outer membrane biosynthesis protein TonB